MQLHPMRRILKDGYLRLQEILQLRRLQRKLTNSACSVRVLRSSTLLPRKRPSFWRAVFVLWRACHFVAFFGSSFPSPSATRRLTDISLLRSFSATALCRSGGQRNRVVLVRGKRFHNGSHRLRRGIHLPHNNVRSMNCHGCCLFTLMRW